MNGLREFINTGTGKIIAIIVVLVVVAIALNSIINLFRGSEIAQLSRQGLFIDATTGKAFNYKLQAGDKIPVLAPSGKNTGYPAEYCWWTKDGKMRPEPFPVLLNQYTGKSEPTFCPDCQRLVTPLNPPAMPNTNPPPTEEEYKRQRPGGGAR